MTNQTQKAASETPFAETPRQTEGGGEVVFSAIAKYLRDRGFALVPRVPSQRMLDEAWAEALAENAAGVWSGMIESHETESHETSSGNSEIGNC